MLSDPTEYRAIIIQSNRPVDRAYWTGAGVATTKNARAAKLYAPLQDINPDFRRLAERGRNPEVAFVNIKKVASTITGVVLTFDGTRMNWIWNGANPSGLWKMYNSLNGQSPFAQSFSGVSSSTRTGTASDFGLVSFSGYYWYVGTSTGGPGIINPGSNVLNSNLVQVP